jgi:hypothetical protein
MSQHETEFEVTIGAVAKDTAPALQRFGSVERAHDQAALQAP